MNCTKLFVAVEQKGLRFMSRNNFFMFNFFYLKSPYFLIIFNEVLVSNFYSAKCLVEFEANVKFGVNFCAREGAEI